MILLSPAAITGVEMAEKKETNKKTLSKSFNILNSLSEDLKELKDKIKKFEEAKEDIMLQGKNSYINELESLLSANRVFLDRCDGRFSDLKVFWQNIEEDG